MSPLRWDVLGVSFLLALPLLALGLRGDLGTHDVVTRLPWCLAAGWGVVALCAGPARRAGRPAPPPPTRTPAPRHPDRGSCGAVHAPAAVRYRKTAASTARVAGRRPQISLTRSAGRPSGRGSRG